MSEFGNVPYHLWLQKDLIAEIERLKAELAEQIKVTAGANQIINQLKARIAELEDDEQNCHCCRMPFCECDEYD